jgi:hypothetical protein
MSVSPEEDPHSRHTRLASVCDQALASAGALTPRQLGDVFNLAGWDVVERPVTWLAVSPDAGPITIPAARPTVGAHATRQLVRYLKEVLDEECGCSA